MLMKVDIQSELVYPDSLVYIKMCLICGTYILKNHFNIGKEVNELWGIPNCKVQLSKVWLYFRKTLGDENCRHICQV